VRSTALKREGDANVLWTLSEGEVQKMSVEVFSEDGEWAHVIGGISEETEVVLSPPESFLQKE